MQHGLSGTAELGRSGTESSDDQEPNRASDPQKLPPNFALNLANKESFGFLLTQKRPWTDNEAPPNRPADTRVRDNRQLTHVTLVWRQGEREDWLRFGKPIAERITDRRQRIESYAAGQAFGLVRWASNDYGTIRSAFDIVHAVDDDGPRVPVPQVDPGGEVLLSVRGWPKVSQVFRLIDAIEASGIDPCDVAHDHWRHIHNRMAGREVPRGYSPARHHAWLQRKALLT
jgi:Protein of unknown function (DUF2840)